MTDLGFSIIEGVLTGQECELLANALGSTVTRNRAGARNLMSHPAISSLAYDSRLMRLAGNALNSDSVPFRATLFDKSSTSNWHVLWHQDRALPLCTRLQSAEWGPWSLKSGVLFALAPAWALERIVALRIHLDPSTNDNGPLRVIPESHQGGVLSAAEILLTVSAVRPRACLVGRGGVLVMRPLLVHSSRKITDDQPRRVLHIEYVNRLDLANNVRLCVA